MREKTCCFTGHRQLSAEVAEHLRHELDHLLPELYASGYRYFGVGGALGFDTLAEEAVLDFRRSHPDCKLILVLPCRDHAARWRFADRLRFRAIQSQADKTVCLAEHYYDGCMLARNRHLVDQSSLCVAFCTRTNGGSAYTVRYAEQNGLKIIRL
ncbi:MAG: DUF1273 family protein [Oscillospiraceae bacterium]|nr:DUF1273 family protein [Oscillospiraceae bacterium]